jgi:hypothetical protein
MIEKEPEIKDVFDIFKLIRYKVLYGNESWDILCTGQKGVGKSSTMLTLALLVDPYYSLNRWAFTTEELMNMRKNARPGNAIVSDEMGTQAALSSQNWMKKESKEAVDMHQLDRTERIINIATTLDVGRINNRIRTQYKVLVNVDKKLGDKDTEGNGLGTSCVVRFIEEDPFAKNSYEQFKRKYFRDNCGRRISRVVIPHPPAEMFKKYSNMRNDFQERLRQKEIEDMKGKDRKKSDQSSNSKVDDLVDRSLLK